MSHLQYGPCYNYDFLVKHKINSKHNFNLNFMPYDSRKRRSKSVRIAFWVDRAWVEIHQNRMAYFYMNAWTYVSTVKKYGQNNSNQELQIVDNLFAHFCMIVIVFA